MVALIIARSPLRYLPSSLFGETTTGAPLVVKGKEFVGISGGEGLRARAEQGEPLSGSANAMLYLAGRLSQSFNRAQVIHKTCVTGTLVFLILQAQERRRVNGDQDSQSVCEIEDCAAIALNRDRSSRQTLCRGYSRATMSRGPTASISSSNHLRHILISLAFGRLCSRRLPRGSNLKCLTALVT